MDKVFSLSYLKANLSLDSISPLALKWERPWNNIYIYIYLWVLERDWLRLIKVIFLLSISGRFELVIPTLAVKILNVLLDQSFPSQKGLVGKGQWKPFTNFYSSSLKMYKSNFCILCIPTYICTISHSNEDFNDGKSDPVYLDLVRTASKREIILYYFITMYFLSL